MRRIRAFFYARGYTEVETPIRLKAPCMELHIDAEPCGDQFLRTSPEIFHKQLLSRGLKRIFEVGKCFRKGELGPVHNPEYTMLEWYRAHSNYMDMLEETKGLFMAVWPDGPADWSMISVSEAFCAYAGWDPVAAYDADRFDLDLVEKVEPALKRTGGCVVLKDYPAEAAALARLKPENPDVAERWELYVGGIELANAYSELTDPDEQRLRFEECARKRKALDRSLYPFPEGFLEALETMPPAGGVAMGIDRLLMLMQKDSDIHSVLPFSEYKRKNASDSGY
jgi:lysyl-tRNA synthetase class 2